ncbi:AHH domain-containing protein [Clostridium estertheticum]|uniref:AHH domain-containing protein n=1 Tax=Clostridium estertheticum TaxID=238834 RepID=A0AA47EP24_9CLOT|nr:AHH domain-containing protein [Clostridium estertheticum]MBU3157928.1 AHH domain-containing protein [Clostridium estertheticum]MBU3179418.1 AHH domain-containing protein [Clostridium estertheticum]MBU3202419.1 AHH domain-containing protein [Clostridium estertheticum]MBW9154744.1 AHH domain-containing protein [Clostridium estertheticum]WAG62148.1 AHH domain-containing protein [Clostridium estertheticum]
MSPYTSIGARESFVGAVTGAISGPFGSLKDIKGIIKLGGVTGGVESLIRQTLDGKGINPITVIKDAGKGILTLGLLHGAGKLIKGASPFIKNTINKIISKNDSAILNIAKKIDNVLAPVRVAQLSTGEKVLLKMEGKNTAQDAMSKMIGKANNNILLKDAKNMKSGIAEGVSETKRLIPGTPGVVTGGDSTKLGKNIMESMGLKRSTKWTGHQAQHIIPAEVADNPILRKIGMNLDETTNGILLRTPDADLSAMSRHRGYHSVYNDVVKRQLNNMDVNQSVDILQKQVFDLQTNLRKLQESGLPLYPSQGATVDLWERSLNRIGK